MKALLSRITAAARAIRLPQATPARVYNASLLTGLGLVAGGAVEAFGTAPALLLVGGLVLGLAVFERLVALKGPR
jgi:hypothetical protein